MAHWRIEFYPPRGSRNSPYDYIVNLEDKSAQATITHRLEFLRDHQFADWPHTWVHKITSDIAQLTAGDHRLMYYLHDRAIVVLHAFRKGSQKTRRRDINRAQSHLDRYLAQRRS